MTKGPEQDAQWLEKPDIQKVLLLLKQGVTNSKVSVLVGKTRGHVSTIKVRLVDLGAL